MSARACMRGLTIFVLVAAGIAGLTDSRAAGPDKPIFERRWIALSTNAVAITGDAWLTLDSITFDGRVTFHLRFVDEVVPVGPGSDWAGIATFSLYEILAPLEPVPIRQGNTLCGHPRFSADIQPARYLAIGYDPWRMTLEIIRFRGASPPEVSLASPVLCGNFAYSLDR